MNCTLFVELIFVGIITSIIGFIISYVTMKINNPKFKFDYWNSLILTFFITGILIHLICEYFGINKYYCAYGNACIKNNINNIK